MKNIFFLLAIATLLLGSSCNKEEMIVFDVTVKNKDNSAVTKGYVQIHATKTQFIGDVTVFREEIPVENGKAYFETPFDPKIEEISVTYWKNSNDRASQTIVGCNNEFSQSTCDMSKGERKFVIDITLQ